MSDIDLYLDQDNELKFNVSIEGSKPGTPKYRLVFEGRDFSYSFYGHQAAPGEVSVTVPSMKTLMKEGNYNAQLEVMIDDRYFVPLEFVANFEQSVRVVAEHTTRAMPKKVGVTATFAKSAEPERTSQAAHVAPKLVERVNTHNNVKPVAPKKDVIGEIDGTPITAEDLRRFLTRK